jgi:hypothetical protein
VGWYRYFCTRRKGLLRAYVILRLSNVSKPARGQRGQKEENRL